VGYPVSTRQSVLKWGGHTTAPDNLWTIATLIDAYYGSITFLGAADT
jgi:hypothetical protein